MRNSLENFLQLPITLRIHENSKTVFVLQKKNFLFQKILPRREYPDDDYLVPTQLTFTYSNSTKETLEKGVKYVQS